MTVISNNAGIDGAGLGLLLESRQIRKMISSYVGENQLFADLHRKGEFEIEFNPQGTLAERIRAGGAGIPAFFTKTGVGTLVAEGKEIREFDGESYVMERGIVADLSVIHAWKADREGNLVYRKTARNFNPLMATAGPITVAEVENLVEPGVSILISFTRRVSLSTGRYTLDSLKTHRATHGAEAWRSKWQNRKERATCSVA